MEQQINQVKELLSEKRKIVITTHANPDADAMGSSFGLLRYLKSKGHSVSFISPTSYADFLAWISGNHEIIVFPNQEERAKKLIKEAQVIFCLDFNALSRIASMEKPVEESAATKIVIDHHIAPTDFQDILFSDVTSTSTAELVYDFIVNMGDEELVTKELAECIYAGILADTGAFQYPVTSAKVHRIVAKLIEQGIDHSGIYQKIFNNFSETRLRLFGYCLTEKMKIFSEYKTGLITLNREELQRFNIKSGDTEGLVNYPLKIEGVNFAVLIIDRTERIKLSFRSQGPFDVNVFARKYFEGGGHKNAAGGQSMETLEAAIKKFEEVLPKYRGALNY